MPLARNRESTAGRLAVAMCRVAALLAAGLALAISGASTAQTVKFLVQTSPLAGFRYHEAAAVFAQMRIGDPLDLHREPYNPYDPSAVSVAWRGRMLGYVPRTQNGALAWAMDRGESVTARVSDLRRHRNPRERLRFDVFVE